MSDVELEICPPHSGERLVLLDREQRLRLSEERGRLVTDWTRRRRDERGNEEAHICIEESRTDGLFQTLLELASSHVAETARRQHSSLNDRGWLGTLRDQLQATLRHHPIERQVVALRAELQRAEAEAERARAALAKAQAGSPTTPEQAKAAWQPWSYPQPGKQ